MRVWATSRSEDKRARALELGADAAFETGARLPERVDAVIETVGEATWSHSLKSLKPGGTIVVCGATSGRPRAPSSTACSSCSCRVVGSTMGTTGELAQLVQLLASSGVRPVIDRVLPLSDARGASPRWSAGEVFGKVVFTP